MSLQKQLVHLNMTGGIEQGTDSFITLPSKLVELQNGLFDDKNTIVRRGGFRVGGGGYDKAHNIRINTHNGRALVEDAVGHWWYNDNDNWLASGPVVDPTAAAGAETYPKVPRLSATRRDIAAQQLPWPSFFSTPYAGNAYDFAISISTNIAVVAFEERDATTLALGTRVVCYDTLRSVVVSSTSFAGLYQPRVIFLSAATTPEFLVFLVSPTSTTAWDIVSKKFTSSGIYSGAGVPGITGIAVNAASLGSINLEAHFDVSYLTTTNSTTTKGVTSLCYRDYSGGSWYVKGKEYLDNSTAGGSWSQSVASQPKCLSACSGTYSSTAKTFIFYMLIGTYTTVRCVTYNSATTGVADTSVVSGIANYQIEVITACEYDSANLALAWHSTYGRLTELSVVPVNKNTTSVGSYNTKIFSDYTHGVLIAGRICLNPTSGTLLLPIAQPLTVTNATNLRPITLMLADVSSQYEASTGALSHNGYQCILAHFGYAECGSWVWLEAQRLPSTFNTCLVHQLLGDYSTAGGRSETALSFKLVDWSSSPLVTGSTSTANQLGSASINGLTYLAGACPLLFDGVNITEASFHFGPELYNYTLSPDSVTSYVGPFTTGESYHYCVTYEWRDSAGNLHQSPPSPVASQDTVFSGSDLYLDFRTCAPITMRRGVRTVLWRTLNGVGASGPFYRAQRADGTVLTDAQIADNATDTLYTTGGILESEPMPACRDIEVFQNRLFFSGMLDGQVLGFTSQADQFFAPSYSAQQSRRVQARNGRIVAARELYGRLVVLCENAVGVLSGTGPSPTGDNDAYSEVDILVKNAGCVWQSPRSAVSVNEGVWFQSNYGLRLFTPNGQLAQSESGFLGAEIDASLANTQTVCAVVGPAKEQVWFYTYNATTYGTVWAWSQAFRQWSLLGRVTNIALDAVYDEATGYTFGGDDIQYYSDSYFADDEGSSFSLIIKTPWLSFAGIQGFQRLYKLMLTGLNTDASVAVQTVTIKAAYNFGQSLSTLVSSDVTPATGGLIQIQHHFATQKCEAVQLQIEIKPKNNDAGKFRLSDITLQVGVKEGLYKLPSGSRV